MPVISYLVRCFQGELPLSCLSRYPYQRLFASEALASQKSKFLMKK